MTTPENRLLRPLLILLIAAGAVFGLGPFLVPTQFADLVGYEGQDVFLFRLAGAATFGYSAGLAAGLNSRWPALRIPFAATATFNSASIVACLIAIVRGDAELVTYLILPAALLFTAGSLYFLRNPPAGGEPAGGARDDLAGSWSRLRCRRSPRPCSVSAGCSAAVRPPGPPATAAPTTSCTGWREAPRSATRLPARAPARSGPLPGGGAGTSWPLRSDKCLLQGPFGGDSDRLLHFVVLAR